LAVVPVKFWWGVVAAAVSVGPGATPAPQVLTETFVEQVVVPAAPWTHEPLSRDLDEHAQCLIDVLGMFGLELTVDNLFIVGDFADVTGGPCAMLP